MRLMLSHDEARFLHDQLRRYIQHVELELARTDKFELQTALARDVDRLVEIANRLETEVRVFEGQDLRSTK